MPDQTILPAINPVQPGAYSAVDASSLAAANQDITAPVSAILGTALGGEPNVPLYFRGVGPAKALLRGGPALDGVRFAFSAGASRVCVIRVGNTPTRSTLALSGTGSVLTLTSIDYGAWTTNIKVTVTATNVITLTYVDALGVTYTEKWDLSTQTVTPALAAAAINGTLYGYTKSNYVTATAGAGTPPFTTLASTPLAGGTDGLVPVAGDWTNGLAVLETQPVSVLTPMTGDATIHALVQAHCIALSASQARSERTAVFGGVSGEAAAAVATRMSTLREKRSKLVYPGMYDFAADGTRTLYDPFYVAAKINGMICSLPDEATSLTHARVPIIDVETRLSTIQGGAIDTLLAAGVSPIAPAPGSGFWMVDSLSGYNLPDGIYRDFHKVRSADAVQVRARQRLEDKFIGTKGLSGSSDAIQKEATDVLNDLKTEQLIRAFLPPVVTPGAGPTSYLVSLPVMLVDTIKFIFLTVALQPSSTVNRDVGTTSAQSLS